ncbi:MAG: SURF1 family protein [Xanthobacteraceae bacterium]
MRAPGPLPAPRGRRRPRWPQGRAWLSGIAALAAFLVLVGLGTWQLQRKAWKDRLLATLSERLSAAPVPLPPPHEWAQVDQAGDEFRRVTLTGDLLHDREALVYTAGSSLRDGAPSGPGYEVFTPARLADGRIVMIDRGFVPENRRAPAERPDGQVSGPVQITGALRWPETRSIFTPADQPARNLWFVRDPQAIAAAKNVDAAPFYVAQEAPSPPGGWPQPARLVPRLPNNHLQYAITWYGLAFALLVVSLAFMFRRRDNAAGPSDSRLYVTNQRD